MKVRLWGSRGPEAFENRLLDIEALKDELAMDIRETIDSDMETIEELGRRVASMRSVLYRVARD